MGGTRSDRRVGWGFRGLVDRDEELDFILSERGRYGRGLSILKY